MTTKTPPLAGPAAPVAPRRPGALRRLPDSGPVRALRAAEPGWAWLTLAGCYLAACWATVVTRTQWGPDSRLYLAWAYRYLGYSEVDAAHRAKAFLFGRDGVGVCAQLCWPPGYEHGYFSGANGAVVGGRPLYPLLSAPFVALFGPWGMMVVSFLGFTLGLLAVVLLAHRLFGRHWGLLAGLGMVAPVTVSRWALMGQTEGLAIGLTAATLLVLPLRRVPRRADLIWFAVLLVLNLCVRQFAIVLAAGVVLAWLWVAVRQRRAGNPWLRFAAVSVGLSLVVLWAQGWVTARFFDGGVDLGTRYRQTVGHLFHVGPGPASIPHVLRYFGGADYAVVRADLPLAATLGVALVALAWRWRSELTALTLGLLTATLALCVVVVYPAYYRYEAPVHAALVLVAVALLADLAARPRRRPASSTEDGPPAGSPVALPPPVGRPAVRIPRLGWLLVGAVLAGSALLVQRRLGRVAWQERPVAVLAGVLLLAFAVAALTLLVDRRFGPGAAVAAGSVLALCGSVVAGAELDLGAAVALAAAAGAVAMLLRPPAPRTGAWALACFGALVLAAVAARPSGLALVGGALAVAAAAAVRQRTPRSPCGRYAVVAVLAGGLGLGWRWYRLGSPLGPADARPLEKLVSAGFRELALDRMLYLLVLVGLAAVLLRRRRPESALAAGTVLVAAPLHWAAPAGPADLLVVVPGLLLAAVALLAPLFAAPEAPPPAPEQGTALYAP